jgi:hypothetical protein
MTGPFDDGSRLHALQDPPTWACQTCLKQWPDPDAALRCSADDQLIGQPLMLVSESWTVVHETDDITVEVYVHGPANVNVSVWQHP